MLKSSSCWILSRGKKFPKEWNIFYFFVFSIYQFRGGVASLRKEISGMKNFMPQYGHGNGRKLKGQL